MCNYTPTYGKVKFCTEKLQTGRTVAPCILLRSLTTGSQGYAPRKELRGFFSAERLPSPLPQILRLLIFKVPRLLSDK